MAWQNPTLVGDGIFAAFYRLNTLPQSAYWSWAQLGASGEVTGVQCAIHVQVADGRYTDAGVVYSLEDGVVTSIRIYGLYSFVGAEEVRGNLEAVGSVQTAASGDEVVEVPDVTLSAATVAANQAQPFNAEDLSFAGMDYAALPLESAKAALGEPASQRQRGGRGGRNLPEPDLERRGADLAGGFGGRPRAVPEGDGRPNRGPARDQGRHAV